MTKTVHVDELRNRIDFAVITIRDDEFEAVLKRFAPRYPVIGGKQHYEFCYMERRDGNNLSVAVVRTLQQAELVAHYVARDIIEDLCPRWLVLAGIAGGVPDSEFCLGDVLLASSFHDFSIGAANESKHPPFEFAVGGGPVHPTVERLLAVLPAWRDRLGKWNQTALLGLEKPLLQVPVNIDSSCFYGEDATKREVRNALSLHFPASGVVRRPLYKVGPVATSNLLLKDTRLLKQWTSCARHVTHVEMEAGGIYQAARRGPSGELPLLCVRGISDIIGFRRSPEWTQFACEVAASFLYAMLSSLPLEYFFDGSERLLPAGIDVGPSEKMPRLNQSPTPTIDLIVSAFETSSTPLLSRTVAQEDRIPRQEEVVLDQFFSNQESRMLCILGSPGSGKTSLLALAAKNAIDAGVVTLAVKADLLPHDSPLETWGRQQLGLDISALDAVRAVSSERRVLVIVDQLDALASMVDLTSERLNDVLDFVTKCSLLPKVSVLCSCRTFDYQHDIRFASLNPEIVELALPSWEEVSEHLARNGVVELATWDHTFRELLRTPQHMQVFVKRFHETGNADPFGSYHLMLHDLWECLVQDSAERELLYALTSELVDKEDLWAPVVRYEDAGDVISSLESKHLLQCEGGKIGFCHQTLLEHAKARLFLKEDRAFCEYVISRQHAIFVRPTVWAVLRYLRDVEPSKYRSELEQLFAAKLRTHLRYLLIDFLGQLPMPEDYEIAIAGQCMIADEDRLRALIAIRGNSEWFRVLRRICFPAVMQRTADEQWPMLGVIVSAWQFARDECLTLIEEYWLPDPEKDALTRRAVGELDKWDERAVDILCTVIRRNDEPTDRLHWAEHIASKISDDRPELAPRVFIETVTREIRTQVDPSGAKARSSHSPFESPECWYTLPKIAEAAPAEFLRLAWQWFVNTCEQQHSGHESSMLYQYSGSCRSLDDPHPSGRAPVMNAFCTAVDTLAKEEPKTFLEITKPTWSTENAVVHRLIIRGLRHVVPQMPDVGLAYLKGDRRRLAVGDFWGGDQTVSTEFIGALTPHLDEDELRELEELFRTWSHYREEVELLEDQKTWDREARLRLFNAIPDRLRSPELSVLIEREMAELPNWNHTRPRIRSGFVRQVPPMPAEAMLTATNGEFLDAIKAVENTDRSSGVRVNVEGGWEEPGGALAAGREIRELAKEHPQRAVELIKVLIANQMEEAAAAATDELSKTALPDHELFSFVRDVADLNAKSEELRSAIGSLLYERCSEGVGLPDDMCAVLENWLSQPWGSSVSVSMDCDPHSEEGEPSYLESILWHRWGDTWNTDYSFWPLLALTHGYLMRSPADTDSWLNLLEKHLNRDISFGTWASYCDELRWIRLKGCDQSRGARTVVSLFSRLPQLARRQTGLQLLAHVSDLLPRPFLVRTLDSLENAERFASRQAYGELLTLIAFRDKKHNWALDRLNVHLTVACDGVALDEAVAVGMAFSAGRLWDELTVREEACRVLCHLIPQTTSRTAQAISTVFWAREDFAAEEATRDLLRTFVDHPKTLSMLDISDLVVHLSGLLPHERALVLGVCQAILASGRVENRLFETGAHLVDIAMTLQRFSDTRSEGLALLEDLLRLGLDDAFRILHHIDIRPGATPRRDASERRRRRRR